MYVDIYDNREQNCGELPFPSPSFDVGLKVVQLQNTSQTKHALCFFSVCVRTMYVETSDNPEQKLLKQHRSPTQWRLESGWLTRGSGCCKTPAEL